MSSSTDADDERPPTGAAQPRRRRKRSRQSLSLDAVVAAALAIVREEGLEALSMTRLAEDLGVGVMTIYGYTRSKDELLDALAFRVAEDMYSDHVDVDDVPWDEELRAHYAAIRQSLLRHPGLAELLMRRDQVFEFHKRARDRVLSHVEQHVAHLRSAGFTPDESVSLFYGLSFWTVGFVTRETSQAAGGDEGEEAMRATPASWVAHLPDRFATLREAGHAMASLNSDEQFRFLLDVFLAGMKARLAGAG